MTDAATIDRLGTELFEALRDRVTVAPLSARHRDLSIDDAYEVSRNFLEKRLSTNGEKVVGKKIGVTSKPVQDMLNVRQPDFGFLTEAMVAEDGRVRMETLIQPRAEAEIAFKLKAPLKGPGSRRKW